ncbi:MAG: DUF5665 domain-containing protein [Symbiobacterium sp.]|uniref:DUF5665 domain-containing protein n=1 Tax=Symbiobacterium sp. TaxID=1971213 RepID=UPI0034642D29
MGLRYRVKRVRRSPVRPAAGADRHPAGRSDVPLPSGLPGGAVRGPVFRRSLSVPHRKPLTERSAAGNESLAELVERLALALERSNVLDYTILLQHPWRMLWINFVGGAARGLGIGIGFTVLSAVLLYILRGLMMANLPVIGDLIATIVRMVDQQLRP